MPMYGGLFLLRFAVGVVFIYHGMLKLRDPKQTAHSMGWTLGQAIGLGMIEFVSALALIGGFGVKFATIALAIIMVGAIYHKTMKWNIPFMSFKATGWEFDFVLLAAILTICSKF